MPFEELPNKIKKRIEKRKSKRDELRAHRKIKLDLTQDNVLDKYKQAYGDTMSDEKLKEYVYYQKLIHDARFKQKKLIKQTVEEVEVEGGETAEPKKKRRKNKDAQVEEVPQS